MKIKINIKNNSVNDNNNNEKNDKIKNILKKAYDEFNKDFLIMDHVFIPIIPGNDPKDLFNVEKQI